MEEYGVRKLIIAVASAGALFASVSFASADTTAATTPAATTTTTTSATTTATAPATAPAAAPTTTTTTTTTTTASAGDEIVCRSLPPPTGTRFGGRHICKPARVWAQEQEQAQHDLAKQEREIPNSVRGN
jgi:hypothetical protein